MRPKIKMTLFALLVTSIAVGIVNATSASNLAAAQGSPTPTPSAYSALIDSEIRGIDPKTIASYRKGEGAGLALPAELNGYPGPRHVLDLSDKLTLTSDQQLKIQALYDVMKPQAISVGNQLLDKEAALEKAFRDGTIDDTTLSQSLTEIGTLQTELRLVHLSAHLVTIKILSPDQIMTYNKLRGYDSSATHTHDGMQMPTAPSGQ